MLWLIVASLLTGTTSAAHTGCYDKGTSCTANTCTKFPEFARNSCAKTCGFCGPSSSGLGGSSSLHSTLGSSSTRTGACYDKDPDCTHEVCRDYPYTAKERCAKFCGLCHDSSSSLSSSHFSSGSSSIHQQSSSSRSRITESSTTIKKGSESTYSICIDKDLDCTVEICRNYPYTAKERCAKTCGLCGTGGNTGSDIGSSGRHTSMGIHESTGRASTSSVRRGSEPVSGGLCIDKDLDCKKETCRDYPYTAKERCAKTCGFCGPDAAGSSTSFSSALASGAVSPSRHASIRTNVPSGIDTSNGSHHSVAHGSHEVSDNTPGYSTLSKDKELQCIDLDIDCTQQTCRDYPYTAKERCAKTCGFCRKELTGTSANTGGRHSSLTDMHSTSSIGSHSSGTLRRGSEPSVATGECKDKDPHCSEQSCLDRPYTARTKCAKTCGFCGEDGSRGSLIDLKSPSIDSGDDGTVITLDNDNTGGTGSGSRPSTAMSGHSVVSGGRTVTSTHDSRRPSIDSMSSRTHSTPKTPSSSITQPTVGAKTRYPGRTGPCADQNEYCEKADCYKYPRFAQRYCEKTCGFC